MGNQDAVWGEKACSCLEGSVDVRNNTPSLFILSVWRTNCTLRMSVFEASWITVDVEYIMQSSFLIRKKDSLVLQWASIFRNMILCEVEWLPQFVWVASLYTLVINDPPTWRLTSISKKDSKWEFSSSLVVAINLLCNTIAMWVLVAVPQYNSF